MCQLKDCPKIDCENPIRTKDDCCPMCPGAFNIRVCYDVILSLEAR